jgi:hypothetical protein
MAATRKSRLGRLLAAVVVVMGFAGGAGPARADVLVNCLTEQPAAGAEVLGPGGAQVPASYQPHPDQEAEDGPEPSAQPARLSPWKALLLTLVIPPPMLTSMAVAEKVSTGPQPSSESPRNFTFATQVKPPAYPGAGGLPLVASAGYPVFTSSTPPSRQTPEPAGLVIGLVGSGITGLASLVRRRKRSAAEGA